MNTAATLPPLIERLAGRGTGAARALLFHVRAEVLSMKISAEIRDFAAEGMTQKSEEFRELGGEVYVKEEIPAAPASD